MWLTDALHKAAQQAPNKTGSIVGNRRMSWSAILDRVRANGGR